VRVVVDQVVIVEVIVVVRVQASLFVGVEE
jgi:hypothetical protein